LGASGLRSAAASSVAITRLYLVINAKYSHSTKALAKLFGGLVVLACLREGLRRWQFAALADKKVAA
jgi:hypothetical protein